MIEISFQQYEHPNRQVYNNSKGGRLKLYHSAIYCRYFFTLNANVTNKYTIWHPNNPNASIPSNWTEYQFLDWEIEFFTGHLSKERVLNIIA